MLNLGRFVREQALYHPDNVAVMIGEKRYTYAQVDAMSNQVANYLQSIGIEKGDKVALSCPNLPYFPAVYYGILKAGAVVVPLNVLFKAREVAYHLDDSDAKAYFVFEGTDELPMAQAGKQAFDETETCKTLVVMTADPAGESPVACDTTLGQVFGSQEPTFDIVTTQAEDTAVILYTSGTTGKPKGAELSQLNMVMNAMVSSELFAVPDEDPKDRVALMALPLFHSFGQTCLMNAIFYAGGAISLLPRFDAKQALQVIQAHEVNTFAGVPTMYWALLNESKELPDEAMDKVRSLLKVCASGGSALAVELLNTFGERFEVDIIEGYGLSETAPVASFNHMDRERKPGSVGQPIFGVEMKVVDENDKEVAQGETGEIVIRGHNVMKGYYKRSDETADAMRSGWFHTGDIGRMDEDGYFFVVDRVKDMILRGGFNVYPREVEEVLVTHPDVSLAAVVGEPDDEYGEEIQAYVVLEPGASLKEDELIAWSKENMAGYKYPRKVFFRDELPMNATGKILRRELRSEAAEAQPA